MNELQAENRELKARLAEALETLDAIRSGAVDAVVVSGDQGEQLFTLQGADHTYRVLVEKMNEGALTLEADGTILYANQRVARMLDAPLTKVIASQLFDWIAPGERERAEALVNARALPLNLELSLKRSDGSGLAVECSASLLEASGSTASVAVVLRDLTERRRTEEVLAQQRLSRAVFSQAAEAIVVLSPDGRVRDLNQSATAMAGRSAIGEHFDTAYPLVDAQQRRLSSQELLSERSSLPATVRAQGEQLQVLVSSRTIVGDDEELVAVVVVLADISEVAQLTARLSRSEAEMRTTLYSIGDAVIATDAVGKVRLMNRTAEELTGWSEEDARGEPLSGLFRLVNERSGASVESPVAKVLSTGNIVGLANHTVLIRRDGSEIPISDSAAPIRLNDGTTTGVVLVFSDQTGQREMERQIRFEKDRAQQYLDVAGVMLVALDPSGLVSMVNPKGCEVLGAEATEIVGRDWFDTFIPELHRDEVRSLFARTIAGDVAPEETYENEIVRKDGSRRLVMWHNSTLQDAEGNIIGSFSSGEDVTDSKKLKAKVAQADRMASMGTLAAGIAHEINNPLAYTLYNLETLVEDLPPIVTDLLKWQASLGLENKSGALRLSPADLEDVVDRLRSACEGVQRIKSVARTLSTFSRVDDGDLAPVDVRQAIEHAQNLANNEIKYRARLMIDVGKLPPVLAAESRLSQVFLNLLRNASEAIDEGDVEDNEIRIIAQTRGDDLIVEIKDTGRGIPEDSLDRIFEPFFSTKDVGAGSGLGLPISRSIVEELGGELTAESTAGQGSVFRVRLPVHVPEQKNIEPAVEPTSKAAVAGGRPKILVVDDEAGIRKSVSHMLRGYEVVTAASGAEGKTILERDQDFALLIFDLMMPEVSGMDLHLWLAETNAELAARTIFVTGGAFTPNARAYLAEVDNVRLEKPLDTTKFKKLVADLIAASHGRG